MNDTKKTPFYKLQNTMSNWIIEAKLSQLIEEHKELQQKFEELEKTVKQNQKKDVHDFNEMFLQFKEFNKTFIDYSKTIDVLNARKEWIDKIIEKIKKFLPI